MKRLLCVILLTAMIIMAAAGCGSSKKDRILYKNNLSKNLTLGDYKDIPVDTKSDTYDEYKKEVLSSDVTDNELYVHKTEGTVADGDTVNIDYTGKKDGVAFEGGTATGSDLEIGSNSFIEGFESGLIGVNIGDTVDLNLTFPENYSNNPDLAGKAVVFTVKVNYVKTTEARAAEDYFKELGFETIKDYNADVKERAIKNYLTDTVVKNSEIKKYPDDVQEILYKSSKNMVETNVKSQYGVDFATYLQYMNQTEDDFKSSIIKDQIKPLMEQQMVLYMIYDKEGFELADKDVNKKIDEILKQYNNVNITADKLKEYYGDYYFEALVIKEKVVDFLYDSAKIS